MTTIQKWGNSLAVRIPASLASKMQLEEGAVVEVVAEHGNIVVVPQAKKKYSLEELLKNCKPGQLHGETDWGREVGREVID